MLLANVNHCTAVKEKELCTYLAGAQLLSRGKRYDSYTPSSVSTQGLQDQRQHLTSVWLSASEDRMTHSWHLLVHLWLWRKAWWTMQQHLNGRHFAWWDYVWFVFYLVCMLRHFSRVQLFVILWTEACQASLSMGILQARILELVPMSFSRESSLPRDQTCVFYVSCIGRQDLYH